MAILAQQNGGRAMYELGELVDCEQEDSDGGTNCVQQGRERHMLSMVAFKTAMACKLAASAHTTCPQKCLDHRCGTCQGAFETLLVLLQAFCAFSAR